MIISELVTNYVMGVVNQVSFIVFDILLGVWLSLSSWLPGLFEVVHLLNS